MRRSRLLLPLVPAVLALPACGSGAADETAASSSAPSPAAAGSTAPRSSSPTSTPGSASPDGAADVDVDDQSGAGYTATAARVSAPEAAFVVVLLEEDDDDDRPVAERLLGSAPVPAGSWADVAVPLDPPLTGSAELEAALYADTDGNGAFDPAADRPVPEPDDDDDDDDAEVDDDAEYRVG